MGYTFRFCSAVGVDAVESEFGDGGHDELFLFSYGRSARLCRIRNVGTLLPRDNDIDWHRMSRTTKEYYLTFQHMDLKAQATKLWSEALLQAYIKAGGTRPLPYETDKSKTKRPDWILPKLPGLSRRTSGGAVMKPIGAAVSVDFALACTDKVDGAH